MRILQFNMMGSVMTQCVESDEEAARLYGEASQALKTYRPGFRNECEETWELVVSDGTRETFRLDKLASVVLVSPGMPPWLRKFNIENERAKLEVAAAAKTSIDAGPA